MNNLIQKRKYTEIEDSEEEEEEVNSVECIPSLSTTTTTTTTTTSLPTTPTDESFNYFLQRIPTERLLTFDQKKNYFDFYLQKELRHHPTLNPTNPPSTELLDFISDLIDVLHYRKETEWLSCYFLFYYLSRKNYSKKKKKLLIVLACACVFVAGKLEEETHDPGIHDYLKVVNLKLKEDSVAVSATELRRAELRLLGLFEWNLNYTTPFMFYYEIVLVMVGKEGLMLDGLTSLFCMYISRFIRDTTTSSVALCCPSVQAIVALVLATNDVPFSKDQRKLKELVDGVYRDYLKQCTIEQKLQVEKYVNFYSKKDIVET